MNGGVGLKRRERLRCRSTPDTSAGGIDFSPNRGAYRSIRPILALIFLLTVPLQADQRLKPRNGPEPSRLFERLTAAETGVDCSLPFPQGASFDLLTDQTSGTGVALGDADGDGLPDIFATRYDLGNRLYRNLGDWRFEDVTERAGVGGGKVWSGGAAFVDIDGDGDLDLYVCVYDAPNLLYINRGNGIFDEKAAEFGLAYSGASVMMAFADYDRDGDLDGYLVTHRLKQGRKHTVPNDTQDAIERGIIRIDNRQVSIRPEYRGLFDLMPRQNGRLELIIAGEPDVLFRNEGNGRFIPISEAAGIRGTGIGLAAAWWDYDGDQWPDLYVSNDYKGADRLYRNNGNGTFTDVAKTALPYTPWFSMGSDSADINNDGYVDLLASDMSGSDHYSRKMGMGDMAKNRWFLMQAQPRQYMRNAVYLGTGTERVLEAAAMTGLANTDWTWSPKFGDFDLDGNIDLFVSNGMSRDFMNGDWVAAIKSRDSLNWLQVPVLTQPNLAFKNLGNLAFESVGEAWGLNRNAVSYGAALADLDRDGDLDLVVADFGEGLSVYRNRGTTGDALLIRLIGGPSNRWGIGAKVTAHLGDLTVTRVLTSAQGFMSSNEPLVHFGIPEGRLVERLEVHWPSGVRQRFSEVRTGRLLTVREASSEERFDAPERRSAPWFEARDPGLNWRHQERNFDDYRIQPLLPARQSRFGPGMAVADVDGDQDEDLFVGGAAGQSGTLFLRTEAGWEERTEPFSADSASEDLGVLFFDADSDDDWDLYVVSGGVEAPEGDAGYRDRLYWNDGEGRFRKAAADVLPADVLAGSVVCAADYDRDGDLDLFVGGRSVPGRYPVAVPNRLLQNQRGRFRIGPALESPVHTSGIVTSALWSDFDDDGWVDLLVTHDWGPVRLFRNRQGKLEDATEQAALRNRFGWWNGIVGADIDNDGDLDYLVANRGRNTKYHGSLEHPDSIYYGDMDGSGKARLVEAGYEGGICYPERGKSCTTAAIPSLRRQFPTFQRFALATLTDIYSPQRLESALRRDVNTIESAVLRNEGQGRFRLEPLSPLAQLAPVFGMIATELNGDSWIDGVLAQNDFSPQPETGRMAGGQGVVLQGKAPGLPEPIWPGRSGFSVAGDAKALVYSDVDRNGSPDLWVAQNDGPLKLFVNRSAARFLAVKLRGAKGNRDAVGAKVTLNIAGLKPQVREVAAGSGYLSQSTATLFFGLGAAGEFAETGELDVRWPDGNRSRHSVPLGPEPYRLISRPGER